MLSINKKIYTFLIKFDDRNIVYLFIRPQLYICYLTQPRQIYICFMNCCIFACHDEDIWTRRKHDSYACRVLLDFHQKLLLRQVNGEGGRWAMIWSCGASCKISQHKKTRPQNISTLVLCWEKGILKLGREKKQPGLF